MEQSKTTANMEEQIAVKGFALAGISTSNNGVKKIYFTESQSNTWVSRELPQAEVVANAAAILEDNEIDLVLMPYSEKNNLEMVSNILNTGKSLRIV